MARFISLLLLAASSSVVLGGPIPKGHRRQLSSSYTNSTSIASLTVKVSQSLHIAEETSSTILPTGEPTPKPVFGFFESPRPSPSEPYANAETAVIIAPVQPTVFTETSPGVTFLLPDGQAIATQTPEVLLSTSYIIPLAPIPTSETQSSATTENVVAPSSIPTESQALNGVPAKGLSSSQAEVESEVQSATSYTPPMFTYSPEEPAATASSTDSTILASSVAASSVVESSVPSSLVVSSAIASTTAGQPAQNGTGMPAFTHPGTPQGTSVLSSTAASSIVSSLPAPGNTTMTTSSRLVVTKTLYTTVFPTPAASHSASATLPSSLRSSVPVSSVAPSSAIAAIPVSPGSSATASSPAGLLPSTSLPVPPVVIVTQYTTVPPSPSSALEETSVASSAHLTSSQAVKPSAAPSSSTLAASSIVSSIAASSIVSSIPSSAPSATASVQPTPTPSSSAAVSTSALPSSEASPGTSYAITNVEPSPTEAPPPPPPSDAPAPPSDAPPAPLPTASSTEGPLIITPIAPSQIFTVTVTEKEKETVTATVTATVTG